MFFLPYSACSQCDFDMATLGGRLPQTKSLARMKVYPDGINAYPSETKGILHVEGCDLTCRGMDSVRDRIIKIYLLLFSWIQNLQISYCFHCRLRRNRTFSQWLQWEKLCRYLPNDIFSLPLFSSKTFPLKRWPCVRRIILATYLQWS